MITHTKGNGYNAYDCIIDICQTKNIAKKNFLVLFSGVFYAWVDDNIRGGKTCTEEVETACVKETQKDTEEWLYAAKRLNEKKTFIIRTLVLWNFTWFQLVANL